MYLYDIAAVRQNVYLLYVPLNHCLILQFKPERINIERNNTLEKIKIKANYESIVNYKNGKLISLVNHLFSFAHCLQS